MLSETPRTPKIPIYSHFLFNFVTFLWGFFMWEPQNPSDLPKHPQIPLLTPISPHFREVSQFKGSFVGGFGDPPLPTPPFWAEPGG